RPFGLNLDLALAVRGARASDDDDVVQDVGDAVAVADHLRAIPFADGLGDVPGPAAAQNVLPCGIAAEPIEPAAIPRDRRSAPLAIELVVRPGARFDGQGRLAGAADENDVAAAAFDDLTFDGLPPAVVRRAVFADPMHQD